MAKNAIKLIVGLGNPGDKYSKTRHNVGFWFVDALAKDENATFNKKDRFKGLVADIRLNEKITLLKPATFMNLSGESVGPMMRFLNISPENILIIHDELDIAAGAIRLKLGGGHGGHNGLRDISKHIGNNFYRLRIGIGHPGSASQVVGYVLNRPTPDEEISINRAIEHGLKHTNDIVIGDNAVVMNSLHSQQF